MMNIFSNAHGYDKRPSVIIACNLVIHGADLSAKNKKNQTPFDLCPDPHLCRMLTQKNLYVLTRMSIDLFIYLLEFYLENINKIILSVNNRSLPPTIQWNVLFVQITNAILCFNHAHTLWPVILVLVELRSAFYARKMFKQESK